MAKSPDDYYQDFLKRFESFTDLKLIEAFNREVGCGGWGTARASYLCAMKFEFERREIDISSISNKNAISYAKRVSLYQIGDFKFVKPID